MKSTRLGVNIDHVATVRNARGEKYPSPLRAALVAQKSGADSITIHLREDRRHIRDKDLSEIIKKLKIPLNLEMSPTNSMLKICLKYKPEYVCLVPEKRTEITTEGGLNLKKKIKIIKKIIKKLQKAKIRCSLFIEPNIKDIFIAKKIKTDCIEIHTGKFCNLYNKGLNYKNEYSKIKNAVKFANKINLEVHAGHGLTFGSAKILSKIKGIKEFNIGHFLIGESIFIGIKDSIKKFKNIIKK
tara:strand:- start:453 stop:1178 length:726 start_codon:yes stop_codon:yes gene_type:complete